MEDRYRKTRNSGIPVSIDIRGARGPNAVIINGIYDPIDESGPNSPIYRKRDDHNMIIELFTATNQWYVKLVSDRGKPKGWMRVSCDMERDGTKPKVVTRPEYCYCFPEVWQGSSWEVQRFVSIVPLKKRIDDDLSEGSQRRDQCCTILVRGAVGSSAVFINGIYEVTSEISGGWPIYRKRGDTEKIIEFSTSTNEWYIKPATEKGRIEGWLCIPSNPPTRPECSSIALIEVWENERWNLQDCVTIEKYTTGYEHISNFRLYCETKKASLQKRLQSSLDCSVDQLLVPMEKKMEGDNQVDRWLESTDDNIRILRKQVMVLENSELIR